VTAVVIDYSYGSESTAIEERIGHEGLVRSNFLKSFQAVCYYPVATRPLAPEIEPFELVEPVYALVIDMPALPPEQRVDAPVPIPYTRERNLSDTSQEHLVAALSGLVVERGPCQHHDAACPPSGDAIGVDEILRKRTPLGWPHSFF
jgi:hypothetical protein